MIGRRVKLARRSRIGYRFTHELSSLAGQQAHETLPPITQHIAKQHKATQHTAGNTTATLHLSTGRKATPWNTSPHNRTKEHIANTQRNITQQLLTDAPHRHERNTTLTPKTQDNTSPRPNATSHTSIHQKTHSQTTPWNTSLPHHCRKHLTKQPEAESHPHHKTSHHRISHTTTQNYQRHHHQLGATPRNTTDLPRRACLLVYYHHFKFRLCMVT